MIKKLKSIIFAFILVQITFTATGQNIIQSTCNGDAANDIESVEEFAREIALLEMASPLHRYHNDIIIPKYYLDSIKNYISTYHNALNNNPLIVDYREFYAYSPYNENGVILLTFDSTQKVFTFENNILEIINDTLQNFIDSLGFTVVCNENNLILSDTNSCCNLNGNFDILYQITSLETIEPLFIMYDYYRFKSRGGNLFKNCLMLYFSDFDETGGNNSYFFSWHYKITNNCEVEVLQFPTEISENKINEMQIFPNPFSNELNLKTNSKIERVELYLIDGKLYITYSELNKKINTSNIHPGLYLIKIVFKDNSEKLKKLIKLN